MSVFFPAASDITQVSFLEVMEPLVGQVQNNSFMTYALAQRIKSRCADMTDLFIRSGG